MRYLAEANITAGSLPSILMRVQMDCGICANASLEVQSNLRQIGITVKVNQFASTDYYAPYGNYSTNLKNKSQIGQLSFLNGGFGWSPSTITPSEYWQTFVGNSSIWGNWAVYSNPIVQACVDAFASSGNVTRIQSLCKAAQAQVYSDAPYAWVGVFGLSEPLGGSLVWDNHQIKDGFLSDPAWSGVSTIPIFNTVRLAGT